MRDINSLKENEAIHISTKKEAKKIAKLFGPEYHNHTLNKPARKAIFESFEFYEYLSGISVAPVHFGKTVTIGSLNYYKSQNFNVYPAAEFLPKKKKKVTREWVEKYVAKALYAKQTQEAVERALHPSKEQISDLVTTDPAILDVNGAEVVSGCLQEGRWYKNPDTKAIFKVTELTEDDVKGYGFDFKGDWCNESGGWGDPIDKELIPATKEDVKNALIEEAKRRGFEVGVKYKSASDGSIETVKKDFTYFSDTDQITDRCGGSVYCEGRWATIIESEKEIDWSVPGQLVQSRVGTIWITSGKNENSTFEAVCIKGNCDFMEGNIESNLPKYAFHKYTGEPITLSNEN